ncbi:CaiB/BaiF CoA transferase family protein [Haladaptatus sp. NG-SE-30]
MTTDEPPLTDVTVVELGHIIAGPFCTLLLADLGAEVIKVEHPEGGDSVRDSSPVGNSSFNYVNRDKLSVTIDLKSEDGAAVFADLVARADVVVENFAPGTVDRIGVGYDDLRSHNPDLVYCSIKGFNDGLYEGYPALDPVAEALSGLMSVTGNPGQPPVRVGTSVADMVAALYGAVSIIAALYQREHTGEGQKLTVPLFESTVALMGYWLAYTQSYDDVPEPLGASHPNWSPYDVFQTDDDSWVFVGPSSQRQWETMCDALDLQLHENERFASPESRRRHDDELNERLTEAFSTFKADELVTRLREVGIPVAPVNDTRDVCDDPHLDATDALAEVSTVEGKETTVRVPRFPVVSSGYARIDSKNPPRLGEDTVAVLRALDYSDQRIAELRNAGAI